MHIFLLFSSDPSIFQRLHETYGLRPSLPLPLLAQPLRGTPRHGHRHRHDGLDPAHFELGGLYHQHPRLRGSNSSPASPTPPRGWSPQIDTVDQANRRMVERASSAFARYFAGTVELNTTTTSLTLDGQVLNAHFGVVDQFSEDTGGVATIFARKGDDFVRIQHLAAQPAGRARHAHLARSQPPGLCTHAQRCPLCRPRQLVWQTLVSQPTSRCATPPVTWWAFGWCSTYFSAFQAGMQQQVSNTRLFEHGGAMVIAPGARSGRCGVHRTPHAPRPKSTWK